MTKHSDSPELTRLSGEQAEERTAREGRMNKEALRKKLEAMKPWSLSLTAPDNTFTTYTISMCRCGLNKDVTDEQCGRCNQLDLLSECSRLASTLARVHDSPYEPDKWQLEVANAIGAKLPSTLREEMEQRAIKANEAARLASRVEELEKGVKAIADRSCYDLLSPWKALGAIEQMAESLLAGAHAEEKG